MASTTFDLRRIFTRFDANNDGKLSPMELRLFMWSVGEELIPEEAETVIGSNDLDGDGLLDFDEFVRLVGCGGVGRNDEERELREAFEMYTTEGEGGITAKSLKSMLRLLGSERSLEECRDMISRFDSNGDGVISFDEFQAMMR